MKGSSQRLKEIVTQRRGILVPGAANALTARVIESLGFEAVYLTGAGLSNTHYGLPDLGFIGLTDVASHTAAIRDATVLPLIVDADTGFGNALQVWQTVKTLERAGADAIQLEDQLSPKRCGHFSGKEVVGLSEMLGKIHAAVDARQDQGFQIIARTDARAGLGMDAALDRAAAFAEAGADMTFVEAPVSSQELRQIGALAWPQVANVVVGGKTPVLAQQELAAMGFSLVLYANAALQGAVRGMHEALAALQREGRLTEDPRLLATFAQRQALVRKPEFDLLEDRFASAERP
jgi:2-methylisocitrate lyase-like PEP mutase family enzyme